MVNFFDERFIVIQDDSRLHRTELNLRQHDRTILISIIAHVFILSSQGPIFGKMHHIDQRLVGRVIENIRIVPRKADVFGSIPLRKGLPPLDGLLGVPPIIRQLILNDENLEIRIARRPDIRGFAEHVLEIVVRVLRIVLHDELDGDARGDLILFENRYIHSFRDISSPNGELFSEAESLRTDMIAFAQPPGQIAP